MRRLTRWSRAKTNDPLFFAFFEPWADASPAFGWWFPCNGPYLCEGDVAVFDESHGDVWREVFAGCGEKGVKVEDERVDFGAHGRGRDE